MLKWLPVVVALGIATPGCGEAPESSREAVDSSVEANKEVVRRFVAAINERDFDALDEVVAPDVVRHSPSTPDLTVSDREQLKAFFRQNLEAMPDEVQTIRMMVAEGDKVALWANYAGTQDGPLGPFPASGRPVDFDFAGILRIEDGRIAEMWVVWDNLAMLTQLGHLAPPGS